MGRKPNHKPTDETRRQVKTMSGMGQRVVDIALVLGVSESTIKRHYKGEIKQGSPTANLAVAESLYSMAVGRSAVYDSKGNCIREELKPDKTAAIFWLKSRCRWTTPTSIAVSGEVEHTHKGDPNEPVLGNLRNLTDEQLRQIEEVAAALEAAEGRGGDGEAHGSGSTSSNGVEARSNGRASRN